MPYISDIKEPSERLTSPKKKEKKIISDVYNFPIENRKEEASVSEQIENFPQRFGIEAASSLWSTPQTLADLWKLGGSKLQELGEEQANRAGREISESERQFTNKVVNAPSNLVRKLGKKFPKIFPSYSEAKEMATNRVNELRRKEGKKPLSEEQGSLEKFGSGLGSASSILAFPGSGLTKGSALLTSGATEAMDLTPGQKLAANLTIPTLTSLTRAIARGTYIPRRGEAEQLYRAGRELGMTNEQLAPILASEGQVSRYGGIASGSQRTRNAFENTHQVLGNIIEDLSNRQSSQQLLTPENENRLLRSLHRIEESIRTRTHRLAPQEETLANFIRDAANDIRNGRTTPAQLIGTWRSVNRIGAGRTELRRVLGPIEEAIGSVDKKTARDLINSNALYSRYMRNLREINPNQFSSYVQAGDIQSLLGGVFSGNPNTLSSSILRFVGSKAIQEISSSFLRNPRAQSLSRNFARAVRSGSRSATFSSLNDLKNYVKNELPETYKEIDWKGIENLEKD